MANWGTSASHFQTFCEFDQTNIVSRRTTKNWLRRWCLIDGKRIVLLSSWGGWHPVSLRHICSEYSDVCKTHINTRSVTCGRAGRLDMFCLLLFSHFPSRISQSSLSPSPFPSESNQSLSDASFTLTPLHSVYPFLPHCTCPLLSSGITPLGLILTFKECETQPAPPLHFPPPPFVCHLSPHPFYVHTLWMCWGLTSLPKTLCAVCTHPLSPLWTAARKDDGVFVCAFQDGIIKNMFWGSWCHLDKYSFISPTTGKFTFF